MDKGGEDKKEQRWDGVGAVSSLHFGPEGQSLPHLCLETAIHLVINSWAGGELRGF